MKKNECYVYVSSNNFWGNKNSHTYEIPCYPEEVTDSISVNWSETSVIGRTPILAYNSTGLRNISFSMDLHREMYNGYQGSYSESSDASSVRIESLLSALKAAVYPKYTNSCVEPPMVIFKFGDLMMRGVIRSLGYQWKKPIVDRKYQMCSVSITMDEIASPLYSQGPLIQTAENPNRLTQSSTAEWIEL